MNSTLTPPVAVLRGHAGIELIPVRDRLWRVARVSGTVLGHIEAVPEKGGDRFQARRLVAGTTTMVEIGTFWRPDDAVDCFR